MAALKLHRIGDGVGAIFPDDVLAQLNAGDGDVLEVVSTSNGVELTSLDADFAAEMKAADQVMRENEAVLRALAK